MHLQLGFCKVPDGLYGGLPAKPRLLDAKAMLCAFFLERRQSEVLWYVQLPLCDGSTSGSVPAGSFQDRVHCS
jgi:hypothetical protein